MKIKYDNFRTANAFLFPLFVMTVARHFGLIDTKPGMEDFVFWMDMVITAAFSITNLALISVLSYNANLGNQNEKT